MNRLRFWGIFFMSLPVIVVMFSFGLLFDVPPKEVWRILMQVKEEEK